MCFWTTFTYTSTTEAKEAVRNNTITVTGFEHQGILPIKRMQTTELTTTKEAVCMCVRARTHARIQTSLEMNISKD